MDSELMKFQKCHDEQDLRKYVKNLDNDFMCSELSKICVKDNGAVVLQLLFSGLSSDASCQEKRMKICRTVLENIEKKLVSPRLTEKLVSVLATQMESLSTDNVVTLLESCLEMMRESQRNEGHNCWKDFIPKLLNKIIDEDFIEYNGSRVTGSEYKSDIVIAICVQEWPNDIITNVASMFIDISLSSEEHLKVVNKICKALPSVSVQEIPPLVHQMLRLTKEDHFMPLFMALNELFNKKLYDNLNKNNNSVEEHSLTEIQTIEGTVLYHIYSIVSSLGPQSVKDFLKTLKDCVNSSSFILSPFCITFLLTISCVSYIFEEEVLNIIRITIIRNYAEEEKIRESAWIQTVVSAAVPADEVFDKIIQNCFRERDKVLKGLVNLGFSLLATPKTRGKESQCEKVWALGSSILVRLISKYGDVTGSILQTLTNQISQVHESTKYTDCLIHIVKKNPLNVLDCSNVLIQLLDNICGRLPGDVGKRIVAVILPLTKMSLSLRDNLIIVLRKSLFPHDKTYREMAVTGILELLKDLKISNLKTLSQSISQSYCGLTQIYSETSAGPGPSHSNEGMCLELLSILREVFKYQHEVKTIFYRGIYESVFVNPELGCHALDNLQNQFDKFFIPGEELPPLHFGNTVRIHGTTPVLQEPIAQLVLAMGLIVSKIEEGTRSSKLRGMFDSLCQRMSDSDVPHFILGKELFDGSPESFVKEEEVRQILGVYEALMGYILSTWAKDSQTHGQMLNSLFRGYCRLSDYARSLGKPDKKKLDEKGKTSKSEDVQDRRKVKNKTFTFRFPATILNFKCACRLLLILYEDSLTWASEQSVAIVKNKREIHRYCFSVILTLLKHSQSAPFVELAKSSTSLYYLTRIGRIIFTKCVKRVNDMKVFDLQTTVLALECFCELIHLVLVNFRGEFSNFLTDISGYKDVAGRESQLKVVLLDILDELSALLEDEMQEEAKEEEVLVRKLSLLLVTAVNILANQLSRGAEAQEVLDKIKRICKEVKVEAPAVAKSVLSLLLNMYLKVKSSGSLLLDLVNCLRGKMNLIDDDEKVEEQSPFAVINEKTANTCVIAVCDALRCLVNEIEWVTARLKAELLIMSLSLNHSANTKDEELYEKERELCRHINFSMKVLSMLCTIAIPPGIYADAVLKEMGNFYSKITIVTKYFILKVGRYHKKLENSKFDKTVKMVDHELSMNMYYFTEHVISAGTGSVEDITGKLQKKDPTFLKNKCLKETKIIPKVIYEKEQFQKFVLQLSNKAKINLAGQTKHAMARDYRLYAKQVKEILEKENIQYEETDADSENNTNEHEEPVEQPSKRQKIEHSQR